MSLNQELKSQILEYIKQPIPQNAKMPIVKRSVPVPFFGNIEGAEAATISINPSNLEFEDLHGNILSGAEKRFVDRETFRIKDSDALNENQADKVYKSLIEYFHEDHNPYYDGWFKALDDYAGSLFGGVCYRENSMVHLDIYPWATKQKWNKLPGSAKKVALREYDLLKRILLNRNFKYIYINGKETKEQVEKYFNIKIPEYPITNTKSKCNYVRCMYKYQLGNTLLIGVSCYLQNSYESKEYLTELHKILSENILER